MNLPRINFKLFAAWLALCVSGGALIVWWSGMPFLGGVAIVAAALFVNGVVAEIEDNAPGSFLNSRDKSE
jgi:hypothetical protein